jgi:dynein heavy chain
MGLGKLEFASSQVSVMQNQLTALRPQLLETSDETEKLMIKIEQDTIQVTMVLLLFLPFVSEKERNLA